LMAGRQPAFDGRGQWMCPLPGVANCRCGRSLKDDEDVE
jgi:hypothetical protein